jgi:hypothetical protein
MPIINLTDDELAAVTAAIRRLIDEDRFPHAPRLDPLRSAFAKLDAAPKLTPDPPLPKTPPPTRGGEALDLAAFLSPSLAAMITRAPHRLA